MARYSRLTNGLHCSVFLVGQTLPTALAQRVPDAFAFDFLSACAGAELCFRPDEVQFGYWACDKLSSYLRNGDEPHRGGPSVLAPLHIFDVMDVAYTHPEGGFLSKHVQENPDCQPYRTLRGWMTAKPTSTTRSAKSLARPERVGCRSAPGPPQWRSATTWRTSSTWTACGTLRPPRRGPLSWRSVNVVKFGELVTTLGACAVMQRTL